MKYRINKGFTLVELIVVTTILTILGSIGFVSYVSYVSTARDSNRITEMGNIRSGLQSYMIRGELPQPTDHVSIMSGTELIAYQGYVGASVLNSIGLLRGGKDPQNGAYYSYYLLQNKNHFQLMGFLEEATSSFVGELTPHSYAENMYMEKYPVVLGASLGIMLGTGADENMPIQELEEITISGAGLLDIASTNIEYTAMISNTQEISGNHLLLGTVKALAKSGGMIAKSCEDLLQSQPGLAGKDGNYMISFNEEFPVETYCDMTNGVL